MATNEVLVTGATGNTGTPTVKLLRDAGHRVRAFIHDIDELSESLEELGAEVVAGDFLDFDAVSSAMAGVTAAYFCYPIPQVGCCRPPRSSLRPPARPACTRWSTCRRSRRVGRPGATLHVSTGWPSVCWTAPPW
ncbi:MAG TPA: NAD(P)H-binding protein [Mycobacterium sp.]|nr:NAD(P)H-binding protein [Mycobacterium sp.]